MPTATESVFEQKAMQAIAEAVMNRTLADAPVITVHLTSGPRSTTSQFLGEYYMHTCKENSLPEALVLKCRRMDETEDLDITSMCRYIAIVSDGNGEWRIFNPEGVAWYQSAESEPTFDSLVHRGLLCAKN